MSAEQKLHFYYELMWEYIGMAADELRFAWKRLRRCRFDGVAEFAGALMTFAAVFVGIPLLMAIMAAL